MPDRNRFLTAVGYVVILGSAFWVGTRFGGSPSGKFGLFLGVCIMWWALLGWVQGMIGGRKR